MRAAHGPGERGSFHLSPRKDVCRRERAARAARHGRTGGRKCPVNFRVVTCRRGINPATHWVFPQFFTSCKIAWTSVFFSPDDCPLVLVFAPLSGPFGGLSARPFLERSSTASWPFFFTKYVFSTFLLPLFLAFSTAVSLDFLGSFCTAARPAVSLLFIFGLASA